MPNFRLETNISADKIPANFLSDTTELISELLGKPLIQCSASIIPDVRFFWGGDGNSPCGTSRLMSIGKLGAEQNKIISAALFAHIEKNLGIKPDRMNIWFHDVPPAELGYDGTTCLELLK